MPRKGFKTITVTDQVHQEVKIRAEEANRTIREYVEFLLAKDKVAEEGA